MCHYLMSNCCHFNILYATTNSILYIVMDETTKFTSNMCHELQLFVCEKPHPLVAKSLCCCVHQSQ
jgi:hypothetical protein